VPTVHLTKSVIDGLATPPKDTVYWDAGLPGFGVKVTPKARRVFIALYRTGGAGSRLRKYTIGPYGRITLSMARGEAQKIFAARLAGRDPAGEKREAKRRMTADRVDDLVEAFILQHVSKNRSAGDISRMLRREVVSRWAGRSVHDVKKRDVIDLVGEVVQRGTPIAANKLLKTIKTFFTWCVGRAVLELSPAAGIPLPGKEVQRDRLLNDRELTAVIKAARRIGGPYGNVVELLALTGQRRQEVAELTWSEIDVAACIWTLPGSRTKNGKPHIVHLSSPALALLEQAPRNGDHVFSISGERPYSDFGKGKRELDSGSDVTHWCLHDLRRTCVSGMARLGVPPHIADKILNHQSGSISGVAAVYQRHDFIAERKDALDCWGAHIEALVGARPNGSEIR
jgi:integrase